jgi:hypothetical protein
VKPQVVHFSGHGAGQDGLFFQDEAGHSRLVGTTALADLFRLFAGQVGCVVLNACSSKPQAEAIAAHIDYVIGTSHSIGDRAAMKFAVGFYRVIAAGKPVDFAFELGCNAIELESIPEYLTPVLCLRPAPPPGILIVPDAHYYDETSFLQSLSAVLRQPTDRIAVERYVGNCEKYRNDANINVVLIDPASPTAHSFDDAAVFIDLVRETFKYVDVVVICETATTIGDFVARTGNRFERFFALAYESETTPGSARSSGKPSEELIKTIRKCEQVHRRKREQRRAGDLYKLRLRRREAPCCPARGALCAAPSPLPGVRRPVVPAGLRAVARVQDSGDNELGAP